MSWGLIPTPTSPDVTLFNKRTCEERGSDVGLQTAAVVVQSRQRHLQVVDTVGGRRLPRHLLAPFDPDDVKAQSRQLVRIAGVQTFNDVMVPGVTACQHALYLPTSNNTSSAMNSTNNIQQRISSAMNSTNNLQQHISGNNGQHKQPKQPQAVHHFNNGQYKQPKTTDNNMPFVDLNKRQCKQLKTK